MATEASLSSALIKGMVAAGHYVYKASDRFTVGVADISGVSSDGRALAVEVKLVGVWPKRGGSKALKRPISYQQLNFLEEIDERGGSAWIAVGYPPQSARGVSVQLFTVDGWKAASLLSFPEGQEFIGENISSDSLKNEMGRVLEGSLSRGFMWP
jgi:hypothetical protein